MKRLAKWSETDSYIVQLRALRARISVLKFTDPQATLLHEEINQLQMQLRRNTPQPTENT